MTTFSKPVASRVGAAELWMSLLAAGINFHWEDDPASWIDTRTGERCLTNEQARLVRARFAEVERLNDDRCYGDAVLLLRLALFLGREALSKVDPTRLDRVTRISNEAEARLLLTPS